MRDPAGVPSDDAAATGDPPPLADVQTAPLIRTPDRRLRVFVSSTLQELAPERDAARAAIAALHLTPVMFELGARPYPPQDLYRAYLAQSDVFVGIYWQQYGWVGPGMTISGLEDEYQRSGSLPRLVYLKEPAPSRDPLLARMLDGIRSSGSTSYRRFSTPDELRRLLEDDLAVLLTERFELGRAPAPVAAPAAADGPATPDGRRRWSRVPAPATRLIGREHEVEFLRDELVTDGARLVTITGAGGTGKTRLAIEVAHALEAEFPDGVCFVDLSPLTDHRQVVPTIARALGIVDAGGQSMDEALHLRLRDARALLVLDNFERVIAAAPEVGRILESAPGVSVLATSREPLRSRWEHEFPLTPLPTPRRHLPADELTEVPAVALLVDRARAVLPDFDVTEANAEAVAEISRRLDGLPLAIELAAARLRVLPPAAMLARLEHRLDLLKGGARDAPERHRALREAIAWSHDLLPPRERAVFRRLAVFAGGWTLDAAQEVCASGPEDGAPEITPDGVLDALEELAGKSLVVASWDERGEARYRLLETIREFALERLREAGEEATYRRRHGHWLVALAERAAVEFWSPRLPALLDELERESDNFRAAGEWAMASGDSVQDALRGAGYLWGFWEIRGYLREGEAILERLLSLPEAAAPTPERARALDGAAWLATLQLKFDIADKRYREAQEIWETVDEPVMYGWSLTHRGMLEYNLAHEEQAKAYFTRGLELGRANDEPLLEGWCLFGLGHVAWLAGDLDTAERLLTQSLDLSTGAGVAWGVAWAQFSLGALAIVRGDLDGARSRLQTSLRLRWEIRDRRCLADSLGTIGALDVLRGDAERGVRLMGATEVLRESSGALLAPWLAPLNEQAAALARAELGDEAYEAAWAAGRAMRTEDAVATGLGERADEDGQTAVA